MNLNQVTLPAADIAESVSFYRGLGFPQIVNSPHYARFECPVGDTTFSLHIAENFTANEHYVTYFEIADLDDFVHHKSADGYRFHQPPTDMRWQWREARLRDPAGNMICFYWAGEMRKNPPWRVPSAES